MNVLIKRLAPVAVGCVSILAVLGLAEVGFRLWGSYEPSPRLFPGEIQTEDDPYADPLIGWKLQPSARIPEHQAEYSVTYQTNPQGFRSPYDFAQPKTERRIAFVGDSFTFGSGVADDETFVALVDEALPGTQVFNYGIGAFGIDQMWMTLRHYALKHEPDAVVLAFIRSDLERSMTAFRDGHIWRSKPTFTLDGGKLRRLTAEDRPTGLWWRALRRLRLMELWRRTDASLSRSRPWARHWRLNGALLAAMKADCDAAGVPFLVVHLPVNRRHDFPLLESGMASLGIPARDLAPLFPRESDALFYPIDHHFTAQGHRLTARLLIEFLADQELLAEPQVGKSGLTGPASP